MSTQIQPSGYEADTFNEPDLEAQSSDTLHGPQNEECDQETESRESNAVDEKKDIDPNEVMFEVNDPDNTNSNMSLVKKWSVVAVLCFATAIITMLSSVWSYSEPSISHKYHVGRVVGTLGITLIMVGLGIGPMLLSPLSERYGRKPMYILGLILSCAFQFLTAFADNLGGILFGRFMSGFFGSVFVSVVNGTFTDIFNKSEIAPAIAIFGVSPFVGPSIGPLFSAGINKYLNWRWPFYIMLMLHGVSLILVILFVPETYEPVLLLKKARKLRKETGNDSLRCALEKEDHGSLWMTILKAPKRPFLLLLRDPMILILCIYTGLVLAIIYLFFVAFPYIFKTVFKFDNISQGLSFLGLLIGLSIGACAAPSFQNHYNRIEAKGKAEPEDRLYALILASFLLPIGMFIIAWTSFSYLHWIGPIIGSTVYGVGCSLAFTGVIGYIADAYKLYSASAMACNSLVRSFMAGGFPLFALQMYEKLGVNWASSLLAFLLVVMIPFPLLFFKYGKSIRAKSPYAWNVE
ncbi:Polyamine transporter 3 [Wickerhamomyces ciferrii]|uniref:Polyamine transporter 3 n=1 Tax=Wickerhamomyces ciferrii (strain ATCC 14091 / BCRC 22168 / CBS 111 / JCM 3599 / NBRC 0793 / NRRL Y-1031 F-60-10) TaxID=1206466 RepID=K0KY74_WICCF|nr:Polyamine transporter 3 [Wickerhamomyces ciferrii]CCH46404.1 Polyamine transporter 3 [Wickerhamomyces ciferrii]